jgi:hypothetical protein
VGTGGLEAIQLATRLQRGDPPFEPTAPAPEEDASAEDGDAAAGEMNEREVKR